MWRDVEIATAQEEVKKLYVCVHLEFKRDFCQSKFKKQGDMYTHIHVDMYAQL